MSQKYSHIRSAKAGEENLEERLAAYYGPPLPPRTLPETSWLQLQHKLPSLAPRRQFRLHRISTLKSSTVPVDFQETFVDLIRQVGYRRPPPMLRCSFRASINQPGVTISSLGRGSIRLILPEQDRHTIQRLELELLMSTGLARYAGTSHPLFVFPRLLLLCSLLVAIASPALATLDRRFLWSFFITLASTFALSCLNSWQRRLLAFQADRQAVRWLGRTQVCRGLHLLADHGKARRRASLSEPSLRERITRVCGTPIATEDECLTLVR